MEVVLQENFPALGYVGDKVRVRGGYARNSRTIKAPK